MPTSFLDRIKAAGADGYAGDQHGGAAGHDGSGLPTGTAGNFMFATGIECSNPTINGGQHAPRPARRVRPLRPIQGGPRAREGDGPEGAPLRAPVPGRRPDRGPLRLGLCRRGDGGDQTPRDHADPRPDALWRAGLGGQLPEPGPADALRALRRRRREALPPRPLLHARQRDLRHGPHLRAGRRLERAADNRQGLRDRAQALRRGFNPRHAADRAGAPGLRHRAVRVGRVHARGGRLAEPRDAHRQQDALSLAGPALRQPPPTPRCTSTSWTTACRAPSTTGSWPASRPATRSWATTTTAKTSASSLPTALSARRRTCSGGTSSRTSTSSATASR